MASRRNQSSVRSDRSQFEGTRNHSIVIVISLVQNTEVASRTESVQLSTKSREVGWSKTASTKAKQEYVTLKLNSSS